VIAIIGGLGAAALWATATLVSSKSSRMIGSRVVIGWVMLVGVIVGLPFAVASAPPAEVTPTAIGLLLLTGICYVAGLSLTYAAISIGKVSVVAPIVATEGALAAVIAVALGDTIGLTAGLMLIVIAVGVVLASLEPARPEVPVGGIDITADAIEGPATPESEAAATGRARLPTDAETRRAAILSVCAALIFGVGLVATGKAAALVPVAWVAVAARLVGVIAVTLPLLVRRRLTVTRAALPLVVIAGTGEVFGSVLSAWGSRDSIAITAVLGSQFAAIAAVAAFILFGERLSRVQVIGVVLIVSGVTLLAAATA
jgi:drug/metabolite transporter (DMT)-like permease